MQKGFTLIELLIVFAIIGILSAIAVPNYLKYQCKERAIHMGLTKSEALDNCNEESDAERINTAWENGRKLPGVMPRQEQKTVPAQNICAEQEDEILRLKAEIERLRQPTQLQTQPPGWKD